MRAAEARLPQPVDTPLTRVGGAARVGESCLTRVGGAARGHATGADLPTAVDADLGAGVEARRGPGLLALVASRAERWLLEPAQPRPLAVDPPTEVRPVIAMPAAQPSSS